jgi:hypothetical protein
MENCRPDEFRIVVLPNGETEPELEHLLTVAEITNKYHFTSLEGWARRATQKAAKTHPFNRNSSSVLRRLLALAFVCDDAGLRNFTVTLWLDLIFRSKISPIPALSVADHYSIRRFQGLAYYTQLQRMERVMDRTKGLISELPECREMSQEQLLRILSGHWSLTAHSDRIFRTPPTFSRGRGCSSNKHVQCVLTWEKRWTEMVERYDATRKPSSAEIMRKIFVVENSLSSDQVMGDVMGPSCRGEALNSCQQFSQDIADKLWEHFLLPVSQTGDHS